MEISQKYKKLEPREHVLQRPGMYIGSVQEDTCDAWVLNDETHRMIKETVRYVPGLFKIFDEILVNAVDHIQRLKSSARPVRNIRVSIQQDSGIIEVVNDGDGIDVAKHPEHDMYVPEMIFGHLLTSANYDDSESRTIGGQNGIGAKATNIFSTWFEIETVDAVRQLVFVQKFESNMSARSKPSVRKCTKKPYTRIAFLPDYARFGTTGLSRDMFKLMQKRVYDTAAITESDVSVHFNGTKLDTRNFEKYVDLYFGPKSEHERVHERPNERWDIVAAPTDFNGFEQVSFVNGIWTSRGGKHVDAVLGQIVRRLSELIEKKHKTAVKPQSIRNHLMLFVNATIVNPTFDSQTKETLTTPSANFGSKVELSDKFMDKLFKSGIVERVMAIAEMQDAKKLQKTDGKKQSRIRGLPKLEDANWAGTAKSRECTLILTEGDSAMTMAISGLSEVGRDRYGVFPLKGKLLNVKDLAMKKIAENEEINHLKKILGLETGREYTSVSDLRYGKLMLMTDQDHDGSHIKGLIFNMFHSLWPSLVKCNTFLTSMLTPIVKVSKSNRVVQFYNMTDYDNWLKLNGNGKGWSIKYYKGLGTSTADEAKQYFRDLKVVRYAHTPKSDERLDLAFNKKKADERKAWLEHYDRQQVLDYATSVIDYETFVDRELIHFSNYDVERSIPSVCDGLKVSQRKILFACFKKHLRDKEIKVAQLAGYVSENAAYHHGEASLQAAIIGMAQNFVGSNNVNLLSPNGQFGTRRCGGKDASSPRYIFTVLNPLTDHVFHKDDADILTYLEDDGLKVEPEFYMPVIPLVLINGAVGIGTGFSTNVPCYNPLDVVRAIKCMLRGEACPDLVPWYKGFKGTIESAGAGKFVSKGVYRRVGDARVEITELPIGVWTQDFKELLEDLMDKVPDIKHYESHYTETAIRFVVHFASKEVCDAYMGSKIESDLKLASTKGLSTTNMYLFNAKGQIQKYETAMDVLRDFFDIRLAMYAKRKQAVLMRLERALDVLQNKLRFVLSVVREELKVHTCTKAELDAYLVAHAYLATDDGFEYLTRIPIYQFTMDKVNELRRDIEQAETDVAAIRDLDTRTWWTRELDAFATAYAKS